MFDNSRQDDLLNRLKSCVGSLKLQPSAQKMGVKQNNSFFKENHMPTKQSLMPYPLASNQKIQNMGTNGYERKPMSSLSNQSWTLRSKYKDDYVAEKPKQQFLVSGKQNSFCANIEQSKFNEDLARFKSGLNSFRTKDPEIATQLDKYRMNDSYKQNQVKNSIARRYSQMHNQKNYSSKVAESSYSYLKPSKTIEKSLEPTKITNNPKIVENFKPLRYREELQQRKNLMNQDYTLIAEKQLPSARKQVLPGNIRKENYSLSMQKQPATISYNRPNLTSQQRQIPQKIQLNIPKPNDKPQTHEFLKKSIENQEGDCSALAKLKKISELNEKINERIRYIINVFEEQK